MAMKWNEISEKYPNQAFASTPGVKKLITYV